MRLRALVPGLALLAGAGACSDVSLSPSVPASLEFANFAMPAIVVGDSLRNIDGVAVPAQSIVRNQQGDVLADAIVRYTYADANRDTAIFVDSLTGYIVSLKPLKTAGTSVRIAALLGTSLQAIRTVLVTLRPDSMDRVGAPPVDTLRVTPTDTGSVAAATNTSGAITVFVRSKQDSSVTQVSNWLVKYELLQPANPGNDSTAGVFLVNDVRAMSNIDTTDASGSTSRFVRVRPSKFPAGSTADSAVVQASVTYKGKPVAGSPILVVVPIKKN